MRKYIIFSLVFLFIASISLMAQDDEVLKGMKNKKGFPFYIYLDSYNRVNHYIPSGWMGDYGDIRINDRWNTKPYSGKTCIQIKYTAERKQGAGWAGIYWQNPANNWGNTKAGWDLTGAKMIYFAARGEKGGELIECKMGGITGQYSDSANGTSGPIELTKDWQVYEIDLADMELNFIIGGFCVVMPGDSNPDGCTFYLDEIYYTDKTSAAPLENKPEDKSTKSKKKTK